MLVDIAKADDVREAIKEKINIRKVLEINEEDFVQVDEDRRHKTVKI